MKTIKHECLDTYDSIYHKLNNLKSVLNIIEYCDVLELYPFTVNNLAFMLEEITESLEIATRKLFHLAVDEED